MIFDIDCILRVHPYFLPLSFTQCYKGTVASPSVSVWLKVALNPWQVTGLSQAPDKDTTVNRGHDDTQTSQ